MKDVMFILTSVLLNRTAQLVCSFSQQICHVEAVKGEVGLFITFPNLAIAGYAEDYRQVRL
jgi:hypothetical protein